MALLAPGSREPLCLRLAARMVGEVPPAGASNAKLTIGKGKGISSTSGLFRPSGSTLVDPKDIVPFPYCGPWAGRTSPAPSRKGTALCARTGIGAFEDRLAAAEPARGGMGRGGVGGEARLMCIAPRTVGMKDEELSFIATANQSGYESPVLTGGYGKSKNTWREGRVM